MGRDVVCVLWFDHLRAFPYFLRAHLSYLNNTVKVEDIPGTEYLKDVRACTEKYHFGCPRDMH